MNMYCLVAYPGSKLYNDMIARGVKLSEDWEAYAQMSYKFDPVPTQHCSGVDILRFRDQAFDMYYRRPEYLAMMKDKFGDKVLSEINDMMSVKLKRKILGD